MENLPAIQNSMSIIDEKPATPEILRSQVNAIQEAMRSVMQEGTHFGTIPGAGDKKVLLKAGAEKIGLMFRLLPSFEIDRLDLERGHREYIIKCALTNVRGELMGQGMGSCSTLEAKYRWRKSERVCPKCGKETILKGKEEYGGGWYCFGKKGGCNAKFDANDESITSQIVGRAENPDIADVYNTVLKMAKKRAHVDAVLTCTAASDLFTQDIEEVVIVPSPPGVKATIVEHEVKVPSPARSTYQQQGVVPPEPNSKVVMHGNDYVDKDTGEVLHGPGKKLATYPDRTRDSYRWRLNPPWKKKGDDGKDAMPLVRDMLKKMKFIFDAGDKRWYGDVDTIPSKLVQFQDPLTTADDLFGTKLGSTVVKVEKDEEDLNPYGKEKEYTLEGEEIPF